MKVQDVAYFGNIVCRRNFDLKEKLPQLFVDAT